MRLLLIITLLIFSAVSNAATYYVKDDGNDANTGLSDAQAWQTIGKVNGFSFSSGDKVYFKVEDTWTFASEGASRLTIDWSGTSVDNCIDTVTNCVIVGAYYGSGGAETRGTGGLGLPKFYGNVGSIDDAAVIDTGSGVPTSRYDGIVQIGTNSTSQSYVVVENLDIRNSAGRCIASWNTSNSYNVIQNNECRHAVNSGIATRGSMELVYKNYIAQAGFQILYAPATGDGQPCLYMKGTKSVVQGNWVQECYYEGVGAYKSSGFNIIADNTAVAINRIAFYSSEAPNNIFERNLAVEDTNTYTIGTGGSAPSVSYTAWAGMQATEEGIQSEDSDDSHFRNNLVAGLKCGGVSVGCTQDATCTTATGFFYGNTCAGSINGFTKGNSYTQATITAKNNILIDQQAGGVACDFVTGQIGAFDYNYWDVADTSVDDDCEGANDVNTGLELVNTTWATASWSYSNMPTWEDFQLNNSTVDTAGTILSSATHTAANYATSLIQDGYTFDTTAMSQYYDGTTRSGTTPMGALPATTPITNETVPYCQDAGGSGYSGSCTFQAEEHYTCSGAATVDNTADAIANTTDDQAFQYARKCSTVGTWSIPVANGTYLVKIGYVEQYFTSAGSRTFDVSIEGVQEENDLDIYSEAGADDTALIKNYGNITVSDGYLDIQTTSVINKAVVAAIYIETAGISVGTASTSVTFGNEYPSAETIDAITACDVNSDAAITITGVTQPSAGTVAIAGDALTITYTPANTSDTGSQGSTTVTFNDGSSSDTCSIGITLTQAEISTKLIVHNGTRRQLATNLTGLKYWIINEATSVLTASGDDGATDSAGNFKVSSDAIVTGTKYLIVIMIPGISTYGTSTLKNRVYVRENFTAN